MINDIQFQTYFDDNIKILGEKKYRDSYDENNAYSYTYFTFMQSNFSFDSSQRHDA